MSLTMLAPSLTTASTLSPTATISLTTPSKPSDTQASLLASTPTTTTKTGTPSSSSTSSYRLLYRGALSLPDSLLLLDGITFAARLDSSPVKDSITQSASKPKLDLGLLQNPLALALETMRGRPSLRFLGTVKLQEVYLDESGGVEMDIHPVAVLTRIYFENMFCLMSFTGASSSKEAPPERSDFGVKVAIGDNDGPETTEIVIFAQLVPAASDPRTIKLRVARLCQRPPSVQPAKRAPRPDDPIPRKPPAFFIREQHLKRSGSLGAAKGGKELKRVGSASILGGAPGPSKRVKFTNDTNAGMEDFKIPELPVPKPGKGKAKEKDVFGDVTEVGRVQSTKGKPQADEAPIAVVDENTLEKANKNVIKRATIEYLGRTKDPSGKQIDKSHADFSQLYGSIYRGVVFALRAKMRTCTLDLRVVDRLVDMHALMYLGGCGGSAQVLW